MGLGDQDRQRPRARRAAARAARLRRGRRRCARARSEGAGARQGASSTSRSTRTAAPEVRVNETRACASLADALGRLKLQRRDAPALGRRHPGACAAWSRSRTRPRTSGARRRSAAGSGAGARPSDRGLARGAARGGQALAAVVERAPRCDRSASSRRAEAAPAGRPEAIRARLADQIAALLDAVRHARSRPAAPGGGPDRGARPTSARSSTGCAPMSPRRASLLRAGGPVGRKLDFLAQEFNREANTLCAKANDVRADADRARTEGRGRAVPRAGAERGVSAWRTRAVLGRRGLMLVLSSPSGAGKTTLTRNLVERGPQHRAVDLGDDAAAPAVARSTACTITSSTSPISTTCASAAICSNGPRCTATSTARRASRSRQALAHGRDMLFDIDWQGTRQIVEKMRADVVSVFVLPPSMAELKARLERRAEDAPEVIARRLRNARDEIAHWSEYDYVLVNDDLQRTFGELEGDPRGRTAAARAAAGPGPVRPGPAGGARVGSCRPPRPVRTAPSARLVAAPTAPVIDPGRARHDG